MAADKRENSVLFSLRELRQIEEDRVKQEETDARRKVEEEKARAEDEKRKIREDELRRQRDIEEAARAREEEAERRRREEELRLLETERKHQIDAQSRLEEQRLKMEIEAKGKMASNKRIKMLMAIAGGMVLLVGLLIWFVVHQREVSRREQAVAEMKQKALEDRLATFQKQLDQELATASGIKDQIDKDVAALERTHDEAERKQLRDAIAAKKAEWERSQERQKQIRDAADRAAKAPVTLKCDPKDPLCGAGK